MKHIASNYQAGPVQERKLLQSGTKEIRPDQVIPFDEDDNFENF